MKKTTLTTLILLSFVILCHAQKIWSVSKDASQKADFATIQAAINAASPGDYIYVYPSFYENGFTLEKTLTIVGPGYFLDENPNTQVNKMSANINGEITIESNSDGALITGLNIKKNVSINNTTNVVLMRNCLNAIQISESSAIKIKQNYIEGAWNINSSTNFTIAAKSNSSNIEISNNFIRNSGSILEDCSILSELNTFCLIKNNIISGRILCYNINFENNILIFSKKANNSEIESSTFHNNISFDKTFGSNFSNKSDVSTTTLFEGKLANSSTDGQWKLKNESPAKGAGLDGVDCGMFGGSDPYILSGIPDIPTIYYFEAPDAASHTNGISIHVKIKSFQ